MSRGGAAMIFHCTKNRRALVNLHTQKKEDRLRVTKVTADGFCIERL